VGLSESIKYASDVNFAKPIVCNDKNTNLSFLSDQLSCEEVGEKTGRSEHRSWPEEGERSVSSRLSRREAKFRTSTQALLSKFWSRSGLAASARSRSPFNQTHDR
jgi:hypothetical protein